MAYHIYTILSALLLAAASLPSAQGYIYAVMGTGHRISQVTVQGRLACSVSGTPLLGLNTPGAGGVNLGLVCEPMLGGGKTRLGSAVTNATGHFETNVPFDDIPMNEFDPNLCYLQVSLPVSNCDLFPPTGFLKAALVPFQVVDGLFGAVAKFLAGVFVHVD